MYNDALLEGLTTFLVDLGANGLAPLLGEVAPEGCKKLLDALSHVPSGVSERQNVAELLLQALFSAFEPYITAFEEAVLASSGNGEPNDEILIFELSKLYDAFMRIEPLAIEWCEMLGVPELWVTLPVSIRFRILQFDVVANKEYPLKKCVLDFLSRHFKSLLACLEMKRQTHAAESERAASIEEIAELIEDDVLCYLHGLTLTETREVQELLMLVLEGAIEEKLRHLPDSSTENGVLRECLEWGKMVLQPFLFAVLPSLPESNPFMNRNFVECCIALENTIQLRLARKRLDDLWDILIDFPDSIPALEDLRCCIHSTAGYVSYHGPVLREELLTKVKTLLVQRLHRAGVATEDIVHMLLKTVYALFMVFPRSEQDMVYETIECTLNHISTRKDCMEAAVQSINELSELFPAPRDGFASSGGDNRGEGGSTITEPPDFFRVLFTVIPPTELLPRYRDMLASQLLSKDLSDFDISREEEIFERLKCGIGESALSSCGIMFQDISFSKHLTKRIGSKLSRESLGPSMASSQVSLVVLSRMGWPSKPQRLQQVDCDAKIGPLSTSVLTEDFLVHPLFKGAMEEVQKHFATALPDRHLVWRHRLGRVTLRLPQYQAGGQGPMELVPFCVSLFAASVILYVEELDSDGGGAIIDLVAGRMGIEVKELTSELSALSPTLVVCRGDRLFLQNNVLTQPYKNFEEALEEEAKKEELPEALRIQFQKLTLAILRTAPKKSITEIRTSLQKFATASCSLQDLETILKDLVKEQKIIALKDGYSLKK